VGNVIAVTVAASPPGTTAIDGAGVLPIFPDMNTTSAAVCAAVVAYNSALVAVVRKAALSANNAVKPAIMPSFRFQPIHVEEGADSPDDGCCGDEYADD
jgi:hypothetical protein